jgi:hypothetical protein
VAGVVGVEAAGQCLDRSGGGEPGGVNLADDLENLWIVTWFLDGGEGVGTVAAADYVG